MGRNSRSSGRETVVHVASSDQVSSSPSCPLAMASLCVLFESFPPLMALNPWLFFSTGASFACIKFCSFNFFEAGAVRPCGSNRPAGQRVISSSPMSSVPDVLP
ncbi:hypothetical protein VPH35_055573 [Triticum aestivum]